MSRKIRRKKLIKQMNACDLFEKLTEREEVPLTTLAEHARIAEQLLEKAKSLSKDNGKENKRKAKKELEEILGMVVGEVFAASPCKRRRMMSRKNPHVPSSNCWIDEGGNINGLAP